MLLHTNIYIYIQIFTKMKSYKFCDLFCDLLLFLHINTCFSTARPPIGCIKITHHLMGQGFFKLHTVVPVCPIHY